MRALVPCLISLAWLVPSGAAPPADGPAALPTPDEVLAALADRWNAVDELDAVFGRITFEYRSTNRDAPRFGVLQVASDRLQWNRERTLHQQHVYSLSRDPATGPANELWLFSYEDFERCYLSHIARSTVPGSRGSHVSHRVRNSIQAPTGRSARLASVLGLGSGFRPFLATARAGIVVEAREPVDGHDCVRVKAYDSHYWLAADLGYAPVLRLSESVADDGTPHRMETRWMRYEPADGEAELLVARRWWQVSERQASVAEGEPLRWVPQHAVLRAVASVAINNLPDTGWPAEVPLFLGGTFNNAITGLPENRQTIGYEVNRLRREAYETPTPFGIDFPPLREQRERELAAAAEEE